MIPLESIIQKRINEPTRGVTINGSNEKNTKNPFNCRLTAFTARAIINPNRITRGVTTKVNVSVNPMAL